MKTSPKIMATAAVLVMGTASQATTLTFDGLNTTYGDANPIAASMTDDSRTLTYTEAGYVLTLNTANTIGSYYGAHIGDAGDTDTFNWHDGGDNLAGAYVTLTKVGGGAFDLLSFDYANNNTGLTVSAGAYAPIFLAGQTSANGVTTNFRNVSSVTFTSTDYSNNQLDNIQLAASAVPEPASWAMMIAGVGMAGGAMRRQRKVKTTIRFA